MRLVKNFTTISERIPVCIQAISIALQNMNAPTAHVPTMIRRRWKMSASTEKTMEKPRMMPK